MDKARKRLGTPLLTSQMRMPCHKNKYAATSLSEMTPSTRLDSGWTTTNRLTPGIANRSTTCTQRCTCHDKMAFFLRAGARVMIPKRQCSSHQIFTHCAQRVVLAADVHARVFPTGPWPSVQCVVYCCCHLCHDGLPWMLAMGVELSRQAAHAWVGSRWHDRGLP